MPQKLSSYDTWLDGWEYISSDKQQPFGIFERKLIGPMNSFDGRFLAAKRRKTAQMKGTDVMIELIKSVQSVDHAVPIAGF